MSDRIDLRAIPWETPLVQQVMCDEFREDFCVRCGCASLQVVIPPGKNVVVCPGCVIERIRRLRITSLPVWVDSLEWQATTELRGQSSSLAYSSDEFRKCRGCSVWVHSSNIQYLFSGGEARHAPGYCRSCHARRLRGDVEHAG